MTQLDPRDLNQILTAMENRGDHRNGDHLYRALYERLQAEAVEASRFTQPVTVESVETSWVVSWRTPEGATQRQRHDTVEMVRAQVDRVYGHATRIKVVEHVVTHTSRAVPVP